MGSFVPQRVDDKDIKEERKCPLFPRQKTIVSTVLIWERPRHEEVCVRVWTTMKVWEKCEQRSQSESSSALGTTKTGSHQRLEIWTQHATPVAELLQCCTNVHARFFYPDYSVFLELLGQNEFETKTKLSQNWTKQSWLQYRILRLT